MSTSHQYQVTCFSFNSLDTTLFPDKTNDPEYNPRNTGSDTNVYKAMESFINPLAIREEAAWVPGIETVHFETHGLIFPDFISFQERHGLLSEITQEFYGIIRTMEWLRTNYETVTSGGSGIYTTRGDEFLDTGTSVFDPITVVPQIIQDLLYIQGSFEYGQSYLGANFPPPWMSFAVQTLNGDTVTFRVYYDPWSLCTSIPWKAIPITESTMAVDNPVGMIPLVPNPEGGDTELVSNIASIVSEMKNRPYAGFVLHTVTKYDPAVLKNPFPERWIIFYMEYDGIYNTPEYLESFIKTTIIENYPDPVIRETTYPTLFGAPTPSAVIMPIQGIMSDNNGGYVIDPDYVSPKRLTVDLSVVRDFTFYEIMGGGNPGLYGAIRLPVFRTIVGDITTSPPLLNAFVDFATLDITGGEIDVGGDPVGDLFAVGSQYGIDPTITPASEPYAIFQSLVAYAYLILYREGVTPDVDPSFELNTTDTYAGKKAVSFKCGGGKWYVISPAAYNGSVGIPM